MSVIHKCKKLCKINKSTTKDFCFPKMRNNVKSYISYICKSKHLSKPCCSCCVISSGSLIYTSKERITFYVPAFPNK